MNTVSLSYRHLFPLWNYTCACIGICEYVVYGHIGWHVNNTISGPELKSTVPKETKTQTSIKIQGLSDRGEWDTILVKPLVAANNRKAIKICLSRISLFKPWFDSRSYIISSGYCLSLSLFQPAFLYILAYNLSKDQRWKATTSYIHLLS